MTQPFSIKVAFHTVPMSAAGSETLTMHYTTHDDSQSWPTATARVGGVDCSQDVVLYATGVVLRSGSCVNDNLYIENVLEDIYIGSTNVFPPHADSYHLGFFNTQQHFFSLHQPFAQANYVWLRKQPAIVTWTKF